ncbi:MAG TPA: hypothetical protein VK557_07590 [Pyrinomonadaceae bacterium]|nr:hypothetical protein [Pyrinomonadaceae bacterium]
MSVRRPSRSIISIATLALILSAASFATQVQTQRGPSDVVRAFYKALREHRFKDAFAMTIYKSAVEDLTAEEMEDLRPGFEETAAKIPDQVEITSEQINGNAATVFVKIPATDSTPQVTSEPVYLTSSGGTWIVTTPDEAEVKKKGRRFFLDAFIEENQRDIEDLLKRIIAIQIVYGAQHNGAFGDLPALIAADLVAKESGDPKAIGYNFRITISPDGKGYVATAEPTRYGHTGRLSFWMDQTGAIKSADNAGKPVQAK